MPSETPSCMQREEELGVGVVGGEEARGVVVVMVGREGDV